MKNEEKKRLTTATIVANQTLSSRFNSIVLQLPSETSSEMTIFPGQFIQIKIDDSATTYLRRPISINDYDAATGKLTLLVRRAGDGTNHLCDAPTGTHINLILPLGRGFSIPSKQQKILLVGGGVGVAPLLYLGKCLKNRGLSPTFLIGARSADEVLLGNEFSNIGATYISTDDGSAGSHGLVTQNPVIQQDWDMIYCCGPAPMMKGIAKIANDRKICCEVSLENMMACGVGACLCCVEHTVRGNVCVCTEGPVFNIDQLTWFSENR